MTDDFSEKWALGPQSESIRSILEFMAIGLITDVFVWFDFQQETEGLVSKSWQPWVSGCP